MIKNEEKKCNERAEMAVVREQRKNRYHGYAENFLVTDSKERAELEKKIQW